jgi:hypothetical protein
MMAGPAGAAEVQKLYETEVPVFGQGNTQRDEAMRSALHTVLVKVSGMGDIASNPAIGEILASPFQYVQQYRYRNWPPDRPVPSETAVPKQLLWVRFDKQAIDNVLQQNSFPIWGRSRPTTLIWLAIEEHGERHLLNTTQDPVLYNVIKESAQQRGLPLLFPLMDLQDQFNLRVSDIWGGFNEQITKASDRYQTEAVLVGRVFKDRTGRWMGRWTLYEKDSQIQWDNVSGLREGVVEAGIGGTADRLAQRYAQVVDISLQNSYIISITDVKSVASYARLTKYLQSLASVERAVPIRIDQSNIMYKLDIRGNRDRIAQTIALGNVLVPLQQNDVLTSEQQAQNVPYADGAFRMLR